MRSSSRNSLSTKSAITTPTPLGLGVPYSIESQMVLSPGRRSIGQVRSEEHTSELQSHSDLVCRLLLEKKNHMLQQVQPEDLVEFGMIPEFVGRLPLIATLEPLDVATLISSLTEPKNALLKQYQPNFL